VNDVDVFGVRRVLFLRWRPIVLVAREELAQTYSFRDLHRSVEFAVREHEGEQVVSRLVGDPAFLEKLQVAFDLGLQLGSILITVRLQCPLVAFALVPEDKAVAATTFFEGCHVNALSLPRSPHFLPTAVWGELLADLPEAENSSEYSGKRQDPGGHPGSLQEAGELGFEPRQADPESAVLPLHHSPKKAFRGIVTVRVKVGNTTHGVERVLTTFS
jgi:hypothetical protein